MHLRGGVEGEMEELGVGGGDRVSSSQMEVVVLEQ